MRAQLILTLALLQLRSCAAAPYRSAPGLERRGLFDGPEVSSLVQTHPNQYQCAGVDGACGGGSLSQQIQTGPDMGPSTCEGDPGNCGSGVKVDDIVKPNCKGNLTACGVEARPESPPVQTSNSTTTTPDPVSEHPNVKGGDECAGEADCDEREYQADGGCAGTIEACEGSHAKGNHACPGPDCAGEAEQLVIPTA